MSRQLTSIVIDCTFVNLSCAKISAANHLFSQKHYKSKETIYTIIVIHIYGGATYYCTERKIYHFSYYEGCR